MAQVVPCNSITRMLDDVLECNPEERVTLGQIVHTLGERSYGTAMLCIALLSMVPPISVTPGLPVFTGAMLFLLSIQLFFLRRTPWLPGPLRRFSFTRERLARAVARARPWTERLGRVVSPRLSILLRPPFLNIIGLICAVLALLSLVLAPLPAGENVPTAAILIFGLALTAKDGLVALVGLLATASSVALLVYFWGELSVALWEAGRIAVNYVTRIEVPANILWVLGVILVVLGVGSVIRIGALLLTPRRPGSDCGDQKDASLTAGIKPAARRIDSANRIRSLLSWWVLFLLLATVVVLGATAAAMVFAVVSLLGLNEFRRLAQGRVAARFWWLAFLVVPVHYAIAYHGQLTPFWTFVPIGAFLLLLMALVISAETGKFMETGGIILFGLMLAVFLLSHVVLVFSFTGGAGLFLYLIVVTAVNDIAQALWGRTVGRHKITPRVSPNKTWEGFLLGGATAIAVAVGLAPVLTPFGHEPLHVGAFEITGPYLPAVIVGAVLCIGGFFGDLTLSAVKREVGVKDSGDAVPGQGGVLDRIDSLIFTAPLFFYLIYSFCR